MAKKAKVNFTSESGVYYAAGSLVDEKDLKGVDDLVEDIDAGEAELKPENKVLTKEDVKKKQSKQ